MYDHKQIEKIQRLRAEEANLYRTENLVEGRENHYVLFELPYPSGNLHVGHWYAYAIPDTYARYKQLRGYNVLYPIGFDSFGLPAENAAIKHGKDPREWTYQNIDTMREQIKSMGTMIDWSREIIASDPSFIKWNQWLFTQFFKNDIAYQTTGVVNWCPNCNTVIANEQVVDGSCERCGSTIEKREMPQWNYRITDFADALIDDLDDLDWPEHIKEAQRTWIGRSSGAEIDFHLLGADGSKLDQQITVFTTRPDTLFGATYMVLAPEHPLISKLSDQITNMDEVQNYIKKTEGLTERDRLENKLKTGVYLDGVAAINPATKQPIPVYIADYVLAGYGTGAIMAVPAHDERDAEFAAAMNKKLCVDHENPHQNNAPTVERNSVIAFVRAKDTRLYAVQELKDKFEGMTAAIMGGIDAGQTLIDAGLEELTEELGIKDNKARVIKIADHGLSMSYYARHKNENRISNAQAVLFEINSADDLQEISEKEQSLADIKWLDGEAVHDYLSIPAHKIYWQSVCPDEYRQVTPYIETRQVVNPKTNLRVDASAILLVSTDGKYLVQKRSADAPQNPSGISLFGGAIESNESPLECALRELQEELELVPKKMKFLMYKDSKVNPGTTKAIFVVEEVNKSSLALHEGEAILDVSDIHELASAGGKPFVQEIISSYESSSLYGGLGILTCSGKFSGLSSEDAKTAITEAVGGRMVNIYRQRDWSVSRQRYWGCPIPIVYDPKGKAHPVPDEHLPWDLPSDVDHTPDGTAPLARSEELKERTEEIFGAGWTPEVETFDTFVDSSWYFYRYLDPHNDEVIFDPEIMKSWMPLDIYFGGAEHTTMHVLYSRFYAKAMERLGIVNHSEPYQRRINRGLILGPDGNKMSKSKGNVIDPDEQVAIFGADAVRMYLAFLGPFTGANYPWDPNGIVGVKRFLERMYGIKDTLANTSSPEVAKAVNDLVAQVTYSIESLKFNTAVSALMVFSKTAANNDISRDDYATALIVMSTFAPYLSEQLWQDIGMEGFTYNQAWPEFTESAADTVTMAVQINGKVRGQITIESDTDQEVAIAAAQAEESINKWIEGAEFKKVIFVPGKILNLIV